MLRNPGLWVEIPLGFFPGAAQTPGSARPAARLLQHRGVEFIPIIKIVQTHGVFDRAVIVDFVCAEDPFACRVIMVIAANGAVELLDIGLIQCYAGLFFESGLRLRVAWTLVCAGAESVV